MKGTNLSLKLLKRVLLDDDNDALLFGFKKLSLSSSIAVEITDRKKAEAAFFEANKMKLLGKLTSGVAHEVRNPLNGILAIMGALSKELSDDDRFQPYMQHMRNQVTKLTTLMEDLLTLGRPVREENMQEVSMVTLVENAISTWLQTVQTSKPSVRFIKPETLEECIIRAESTCMTQMIINLLENAYNHSPAGAEIVCSVNGKIANAVIFSVKDYGKSIPEEDLSKIFDPFFTTRKVGTGLGLSIVRNIVENHAGTVIAFNNTNDPGATFEIMLPLYVKK
jgi:signal transduction histidine kinase